MSVLTELAAFHFLSLILFFLNLYGHLCVAELPENRKSEDSMVLVKGGVTEVGLEKTHYTTGRRGSHPQN